ncbi:YmfQ family protein [Afifella pfennigii]|uniref:YmfQ family protein n=1 Tax=Afifella pfennigii TaxID=209897 RepID=UPI00047B9285|nr:putative phage tail protein [Afifella pfennigii]
MTRSAAEILTSLIGKRHPGFALGKRGGVLDAVLSGFAAPTADAEAEAEALMDEVDPRTAVKLLPDFERVLGPDPCGRDTEASSVKERQRIAHQRWIAGGGQSIPYFISIAAALGVAIEIEEFWPSRAGVLRAGDRLVAEGEQFIWRVKLAPLGSIKFRAGAGRAGYPLGWIIRSGIECVLQRLAPAHTTLVFSYTLEEGA